VQAEKKQRQRNLLVILDGLAESEYLLQTNSSPASISWLRENLPCQTACPAHTDISTYVDLIAQGCFDEAYLVNRRDNVFPGVLGRICARPCEANCRRSLKDEPVAICWLKRSSGDLRSKSLLPEKPPAVTRTQPISIVGAGPAGLTCARDLRLWGYNTTVYDAMPEPGGMLVGGIPAWRLPREVVKEEVDGYLEALGVEFRLNTRIGANQKIKVEDLLSDYKAVFLAPGCQKPVKLNLPGENLKGFEYGLPWLEKINLSPRQHLNLSAQRVVIIGAGYTAIDCCRTALRLGAAEVYLCYRRSQKEAPLEPQEIEEASKEGIKFVFLVSPVEVLGDEQGKVHGLKLIRNVLTEPDQWGRRTPRPMPGSEFIISCELILAATGQQSDVSWLPEELQAQFKQEGRIIVDPVSWQTTLPGLFAGGDFTQGPRNVISAIADGHKVARSIHRYLSGEELPGEISKLEKVFYPRRELGYLRVGRQLMPCLSMPERLNTATGFPQEKEVEEGYSRQTAVQEAGRCLQCFYNVVIREEYCTLCGACEAVCPEKVIHLVSVKETATGEVATGLKAAVSTLPESATGIVLDETLCVRCGQCVVECPTQAIQMARFSYGDARQPWWVDLDESYTPKRRST
jgi:NADPH-dependent glutamate synthase beta subunit-like oxidoreductase/ferredoxin